MKRIIFTAAIGNADYFKEGLPRLAAYAEKVEAELKVITETTRTNPQHSLLDAFAMAEDDAHHIWIDADILPLQNAIDLFEFCDPRFLWGSQPIGKSFKKHWRPWVRKNYPEIKDLAPYINTGIVSFQKWHALACLSHDKDWPPVGDQEIVNLMWRWAGLPVRMVPHSIHHNWTFAAADSRRSRFRSFYHCGGANKLNKMKRVLRRTPIIKAK